MEFRRHFFLVSLVTIVPFVGCGSNPHPELRPVSGNITFRGQPVEGASIAFYSESSARLASGLTDASGRFHLTSFNTNDGALPGLHKVVVTKSVVDDQEQQALSMDEALKTRSTQRRARQALPKKYASADTTPLEVTVAEDGPNEFAISLHDD